MKQDIKANKIIGQNIGKFRSIEQLTQEELAAQMQSRGCDISRSTLAKIEAGIRHISVAELEAFRKILCMEYADFLKSSFATLSPTPGNHPPHPAKPRLHCQQWPLPI